MQTQATEGRGQEYPGHLWVPVHAPECTCLSTASTSELGTGWEAVPRPAAVAQVGLVRFSVRPEETKDTAVTLGQGVLGLSGLVVPEVTSQIAFSQRMGDPGRQIRDTLGRGCLAGECCSEALEWLHFI